MNIEDIDSKLQKQFRHEVEHLQYKCKKKANGIDVVVGTKENQ